MKIVNNYEAVIGISHKKIPILLKSILIGLMIGVVVSAYRLVLTYAESFSFAIYGYLRSHLLLIPIAFAVLGVLGYLVGTLVFRHGMISGSGIPQVKGIIMGYFKHNWLGTLIAKFVGGTISIFAGLSLGREGPSIQLGACVAEGMGKKLAESRTEKKILIASGASAGLAAAFNAPLAGTIFAMEEIYKYFSPVILLSAMAASVAADFVSKLFFGMSPVFEFHITGSIPLDGYWLLFILGAVLGAAGAFYNVILLKTQRLYKKFSRLTVRTRPIIPFLLAGVLGLVFPVVLGGGHAIIEELQLTTAITYLLLILLVKFAFSMISFGSGAPGGIFFPLLVIGATIGAIFGNAAVTYLGFDPTLFYNFVILAMAGFFTAIVRAPITGVVLLVEMTGSFNQMLSLTIVSIVAYIVADLLKSQPIYESLLESQIAGNKLVRHNHDRLKKVTVEVIVQYGSRAEKVLLKNLQLPKSCLLIAVRRMGEELIPTGDTELIGEDYLTFLTDVEHETNVREVLSELTTGI